MSKVYHIQVGATRYQEYVLTTRVRATNLDEAKKLAFEVVAENLHDLCDDADPVAGQDAWHAESVKELEMSLDQDVSQDLLDVGDDGEEHLEEYSGPSDHPDQVTLFEETQL